MLRRFEQFTLGPTPAWMIAGALLIVGIAAMRPAHSRLAAVGALLRESAIVMALYGLWMYLGSHSGARSAARAYDRGRAVLHAEQATHLDVEAWFQRGILGTRWIVESANIFYATAHFPGMIALLLWAFFRHRDRYAQVRLRVVVVTLTCLLLQLVAVAPPRLLPDSGLVDTPLRYGQSVYDANFAQVSAMPSVHVAWATLVAWEVVRCGRSRWRFGALVFPLLTSWVVMVTGNHWLFDALAGAGIVAVVEGTALAVLGLRAAARADAEPGQAEATVPTRRVLVR